MPFRIPVPAAPSRALQLRAEAAARATRARIKLLALTPVLATVVVVSMLRVQLFGVNTPARIVGAIALAVVGWIAAAQLGAVLQPRLLSRLDPGPAGIASFVVRLVTIIVVLIVALNLAGIDPATLVLGASFTAVVLGLAAQQTIGNLLAGVVLICARPFSIGDRVRFNGFGMDVEGTVASHGLLHIHMKDGDDLVLVPNNTALTMSVRPIREPAAVDMRARLPQDIDPEAIQRAISGALSVPVRDSPHVALEEFNGDDVVVRIRAVPNDSQQGAILARDVLRAVTEISPAASTG